MTLAEFNKKTYLPSSIFFEFDEHEPFFGEEAIKRYIDGKEGRMIWSPKNALGTSLVHEKTQIKDKKLSFKDIIYLIIKNIKNSCIEQSKQEINSIVIGRPVFYNDKDKELDREAEQAMLEILKDLGFKYVEFAYEPIAAATHYEQSLNVEEIALIVDMGGGTSDFTIAKLNKNAHTNDKRILSIGGVHIAGTNFDRRFNLKSMMPELGLGCHYKTLEGKWSIVPPTIHKELATWHKIGFCYNRNNIIYVKNKIYSSDSPYKFERLLQVLEQRLGHHLAIAVEKAKIALSSHEKFFNEISLLEPMINLSVTKEDFEEAISEDVEKILLTLKSTILDAQVSKDSISAVFMTGGASLVPVVRKRILSLLPKAKLIDGDKFGSVAAGLTLIAKRKFG
jgi:hypothetical chaperone protein